MVTVRLPGQLRKYAGGDEFVNGTGRTVLATLESVAIFHPDLRVRIFDTVGGVHPHLAIFHNEELVVGDEYDSRRVVAGDRIDILISIAGGAVGMDAPGPELR